MDVPTPVAEALDGETVQETVSLKGDDALYLSPNRTVHYAAEGLFSDESVSTFGHDAERVTVSEGRRKATVTLDYGTDGTRELTIPVGAVDDVIGPLLGGVLRARGVIEPDEPLESTYRFGELTLVVTARRLIKHVGRAVWDEDYVAVPFEAVQGLDTEEGNVASQLVVHTEARSERIKTPNEGFRSVEETVREALYDFYGVDDRAEFDRVIAPPEEQTEAVESEQTAEDEVVFVSAAGIDPAELREELDALERSIEEQAAALKTQRATLDAQRERIAALRSLLEE